jgi:hypothetical protein
MHVFMADLLGPKINAAMMEKQMLPSDKKKGRTTIEHEASRKERESINSQTGKMDGDLQEEHSGKQGPDIKPF